MLSFILRELIIQKKASLKKKVGLVHADKIETWTMRSVYLQTMGTLLTQVLHFFLQKSLKAYIYMICSC